MARQNTTCSAGQARVHGGWAHDGKWHTNLVHELLDAVGAEKEQAEDLAVLARVVDELGSGCVQFWAHVPIVPSERDHPRETTSNYAPNTINLGASVVAHFCGKRPLRTCVEIRISRRDPSTCRGHSDRGRACPHPGWQRSLPSAKDVNIVCKRDSLHQVHSKWRGDDCL